MSDDYDPLPKLDSQSRQALTQITSLIEKKYYDVDWNFAANYGGIDIDFEKHPRLIRSQSFRDPDYPSSILRFLADTYLNNKESARQIIYYIFQESIDKIEEPHRSALVYLGVINGEEYPTSIPSLSTPRKYLDITSPPDDFYVELINQVNRAYNYNLHTAAQILIRKLLENAVIDILRKRYGGKELEVFYYKQENRFHDFNRLLNNARAKIKNGDFTSVRDIFNDKILDRVNRFREASNSNAHSIIINVKKEELDKNRDELNDIVRLLFRTIGLI